MAVYWPFFVSMLSLTETCGRFAQRRFARTKVDSTNDKQHSTDYNTEMSLS